MPAFCSNFTNFFLTLLVVIVGIYIAVQDPSVQPESYELPSPPKLEGPLSPNTKLRNAQYLLHGQVKGPESLLIENDIIYTGLWDGRIVKIENGIITKEARLIPKPNANCDASFDSEPICGRPLGIRRFDKDRFLIADAYLGLFLLNFDTGKSEKILSSSEVVDGRNCTFFNDVEVLDKDTVFFSCSSSKWDRRRAFPALFEQRSDGRILKYTISSKKLEVLADGFRFPNGVQLSKDKSALFFSETGMARIWKLSLKSKESKPSIFINNLPGLPDNIRETSRGTFLVGLAGFRAEGTFPLFDKIGPMPFIRKFFLSVLPNYVISTILPDAQPSYGFVVEFNEEGKIVDSFQDPDGRSIGFVSEAVESNGFLYLGSFRAPYLAKVPKKGF